MNKTRKIPLTQGKFAIVDAEDYERINRYKWYAQRRVQTYFAARTASCHNGKRGATLLMHREILRAAKDVEVNHRNGEGLDNRKANLRICTHAQGNFAQRKQENTTSIFKGVSWYRAGSKWEADITHKRKQFHLGYFDDEREAARAYDRKAKELFGEFARLNFED